MSPCGIARQVLGIVSCKSPCYILQVTPLGPTGSALAALWTKYERGSKRLFSRRIWKELVLREAFDLDLFVPNKVKNEIPSGTIPDCARCEDICCAGTENVVSLRLRDIATLIDLGKTDLISKKKPRFSERELRTRPFLRELTESFLWRTLPVMKQIGEQRICAALTPEIRCSLHPHWPLSCERFPYTLSAHRRAVAWGTRCPEKKVEPEQRERSEQMFGAAIETYNDRIRDAILLTHGMRELEKLGVTEFLVRPGEDPFEPAHALDLLPIL